MSHSKGLIPSAKVQMFLGYLEGKDYITIAGKGAYQVAQVLVGGDWLAISIDGKGVIGIPEQLVAEAHGFIAHKLRTPNELQVGEVGITDTERLDFMLSNCRQVTVEVTGWGSEGRHYEIYVEQGFMSDKKYPPVHVTSNTEEDFQGVYGMSIKREAIDLAIKECNEKDPE